jgi:hypothetical protein
MSIVLMRQFEAPRGLGDCRMFVAEAPPSGLPKTRVVQIERSDAPALQKAVAGLVRRGIANRWILTIAAFGMPRWGKVFLFGTTGT